MKRIREVIVVEGRYDKNTLSQVVDATVISLGGFAVFNDREKLELSASPGGGAGPHYPDGQRRRGLCDPQLSQGRHCPRTTVKQAYIPDIAG